MTPGELAWRELLAEIVNGKSENPSFVNNLPGGGQMAGLRILRLMSTVFPMKSIGYNAVT